MSALNTGKYFKPPVPEKRHTPEGFGLCHVCQVKKSDGYSINHNPNCLTTLPVVPIVAAVSGVAVKSVI